MTRVGHHTFSVNKSKAPQFGQVLLLKNSAAEPSFQCSARCWAMCLGFPIPSYQESKKTQTLFDAFVRRYCQEAKMVKVYSDQRVILTEEDLEEFKTDLARGLESVHQGTQNSPRCPIAEKRIYETEYQFKNRLKKKYPDARIALLNDKQAVIIPAELKEAFETELATELAKRHIPDVSYVVKPFAEKALAHRYSCPQQTDVCTTTLTALLEKTIAHQYAQEKRNRLDLESIRKLLPSIRTDLNTPAMMAMLVEAGLGPGSNLQDEIIEPFLAKDPEERFKLPYPWEPFKLWVSGQQS